MSSNWTYQGGAGPSGPGPQSCYRHQGRPAYVRCQRCGRPICPECQVPAPVGVQCVDCVHQAQRTMAPARSIFGAPLGQGKPVVTITLIAACVVTFIIQQVVGDRVVVNFGFVPILAASEPWRFITSAFLHGSLIHLAFNMYALWVVGSFLEVMLGRWRLACLYALSALGGSVAILLVTLIAQPHPRTTADVAVWATLTVGASGAVFGLFAAMLLVVKRLGRNAGGILAIIVINVIFSFSVSGISWQGHLGGLVTGAILGLVYAFSGRTKRQRNGMIITAVVAIALVAAGLVLAGLGPKLI